MLIDLDSELPVTLTYYAHCSFLWHTPKGIRVIIDPYRNDEGWYWFTRKFPSVECDLVLITHAHFDHDAANCLPDSASVLRIPGEFHYKDIFIRGILDKHSGTLSKGIPNVMFIIETAGIRFLHIGDNYIQWSKDIKRAVENIDVLMVTVDDACRLLTYSEVHTLIKIVKPRVVIPMHYRIPELMPDTITLKPINKWLSTQPVVRSIGNHSIKLSRKDLPGSLEVWVFEPSPEVFTAPHSHFP
ncbi:MBL fold metallo-hydrolase [Thermodesulfobacteriota bacterium]